MTSGLIDVHGHLLPDFYVEQMIAAGHAHPDGMGGWPGHAASCGAAEGPPSAGSRK